MAVICCIRIGYAFFGAHQKNIFVCAKRVRLALLCVPRKELLLIRRHTHTLQPASVAGVTATVATATASAAAALRAFVVYAMRWVGGVLVVFCCATPGR